MRKPAWILAAIGFAATAMIASPALAQGVKIVPGEDVAFSLNGGQPAGIARTVAVPTPFEAAIGAQMSGQTPPEAPVTEGTPIQNGGGMPAAPVPDAGKLRFRFLQLPGSDHALLIVQNGYAQALVYRARITVRGRSGPTDVCLVLPGRSGVEHWPYAISAIDVSAFELVAWKPADGFPCK